jgi:hypothetical protein
MSMIKLGQLERVPLREVWLKEDRHFTPWLAEEENLRILGDVLGMALEHEETEAGVGPYSADILCKDTSNDSWVVIENQVEPTDHKHLGQILTYSAGLGAKTMVWIAQKFTDEHRAALDWLNEHTAEDISFFGLEIEVWRIGNSQPAPKFNIVCKPNDWSKAVKASAASAGNVSEHKKLQLEFWTALRTWGESNGRIAIGKPAPQHWNTIGAGRAGFQFNLITSYWNSDTNSKGAELRVELGLVSSSSKEHFEKLSSMAEELQAQVDLPLHWYRQENVKQCRIYVRKDADFSDRNQWNEQFTWLAQYFNVFKKVFAPAIQKL